MLSRTTKVLDITDTASGAEGQFVRYEQRDDDTDEPTVILWLGRSDYDAMGEPGQVTVSVEPGDSLNP